MVTWLLVEKIVACSLAVACALAATTAAAQDVAPAKMEQRAYAPYPEQKFANRVLWGDTHLHTSYSTDAGMAGALVGPEDAYRFARGEEVKSTTGLRAKLRRPLDFLVVSDHAENLGMAPFIRESNPLLLKNPLGKRWHDMNKAGKGQEAFFEWLKMMGTGKDEINDKDMARGAWTYITKTADAYNEPGRFTALIGFEWTSQVGGDNLHRVVVFRDDAKRADQVLPMSNFDSNDPEKLWQYMAAYEQKTGGRMLAIPHNGNLSNGLMFAVERFNKKPFDRVYAETRIRREPLVEVTQAKGTGEAHPFLSPEDEFADFDLLDKSNLAGTAPKAQSMLQYEYARSALKMGLEYEQSIGVNPYKFGMIGSTDNHTGLATTDEDNWFGKAHILEPNAKRHEDVLIASPTDPKLSLYGTDLSASGLCGIWTRENTRAALFDAMERKEVYGTSGTRLLVRVFAGWDFGAADMERSDFAEHGYQRGVPMGGDLSAAPAGKAPTFLVRALRDVDGANLDRIQIIKGWLDPKGKALEKIYDVALSDGRQPGANGQVPPVGNTVDVANASYNNSIGDPFLSAFWKDPDFDPKARAFYYVRVLEIPTPRWTAYDAKFYKITMPAGVKMFSQERAYTSPLWYSPK